MAEEQEEPTAEATALLDTARRHAEILYRAGLLDSVEAWTVLFNGGWSPGEATRLLREWGDEV